MANLEGSEPSVAYNKACKKNEILVTGGTGFIGQALCPALIRQGYSLCVLSRTPRVSSADIRYVNSLDEVETPIPPIVINLAGEGIADKRWSHQRKQTLYQSRVGVTESLVQLYSKHGVSPETVISGSAVGFYGAHRDEYLDEDDQFTPGFSHDLCQQWETAAEQFVDSRVCRLRIGVVIGEGGMIGRLKLPFSLGAGGRLGTGEQWFSWISRADLVQTILFLLAHGTLQGPINATSPFPVTNRDFTLALAAQLNRPALMPQPAWLVRLLFGQMGQELLLEGQRVLPERLRAAGFEFQQPHLNDALRHALGR